MRIAMVCMIIYYDHMPFCNDQFAREMKQTTANNKIKPHVVDR